MIGRVRTRWGEKRQGGSYNRLSGAPDNDHQEAATIKRGRKVSNVARSVPVMSTCAIGFGWKNISNRCRIRLAIGRSILNNSYFPYRSIRRKTLSPNKFQRPPQMSCRSRWPYSERVRPIHFWNSSHLGVIIRSPAPLSTRGIVDRLSTPRPQLHPSSDLAGFNNG